MQIEETIEPSKIAGIVRHQNKVVADLLVTNVPISPASFAQMCDMMGLVTHGLCCDRKLN